ncbi:Hypp6443 [Branchiostoma lanceolatum]|uniref:Hypp6443 protein n=1 Tax=Branchiostoma lanceolatum TaxID=7740 RepID=A0A8J9YUF3_BRALA|nr:Hypp6443 [Branchiostoma lanceolatum]
MFLKKNSGSATSILVLLLSTWVLGESSAMKYWWLNPVGKRAPGRDRMVFGAGAGTDRLRELGAMEGAPGPTGRLGDLQALKQRLIALRMGERGDKLIQEAAQGYTLEDSRPFSHQNLRSARSSRPVPVGGSHEGAPPLSPYWQALVGELSSSHSHTNRDPYARVYEFLSRDGGEKITCIGFHVRVPEDESSPEDRMTLAQR